MADNGSGLRVRFAPSPTGYLHVGGLRTALYNFLFARKHGGTFLLRIEDTDQKRFVPGAAESLVWVLSDLGLPPDEGVVLRDDALSEKGEHGPYTQSKRLDVYKKYAEELLKNKKAYHCFCSSDRLQQVREEQARNKQASKYDKHCLSLSEGEVKKKIESGEANVVRLNVDPGHGDVVFDDMVRGVVKIHTKDIDDQVLVKSDGFPTYHLANVVDDHLMGITHVIRAEEWLPSTPKHILLYEAFGWEIPQFAHLPLLLNPNKSKLSKRQGDVAVEDYLGKGYLKEALINFVALLGWNPGEGSTQEIFSLGELEKAFELKNVHKAGAVFDLRKFDWMNAEYIKRLSPDELYGKVLPFLEKKEWYREWNMEHRMWSDEEKKDFFKKSLTIEQERLTKLSDVGEGNPFFFDSVLLYDTALLNWKENSAEMTKETLVRVGKILSDIPEEEWTREDLEKILMGAAGDYAQSLGGIEAGRGRGDLLWPLRVALTGREKSPSPFDVAWVLGKDESLKRVRKASEMLS